MLIHNKRLHPRRPCEPGEHYHGCMLHDMHEETSNVRSRASPVSRSRTSSQCSSSSLQNQRRQRNHSTSSSNSALHSPRTSTPHSVSWRVPSDASVPNKRYSLGAFPNTCDQINSLFNDVVDAPSKPSLKPASSATTKQKSKSTICLNSSLISASEISKPDKRNHTVTFRCYDSPDEIIANLFPGIDEADKEIKFLRKGHGAAQMAKTRTAPKEWTNYVRSASATGNYAVSSDSRKTRSYSGDNNAGNKERYRLHSHSNGRLHGIERDFDNLWCVVKRLNAMVGCVSVCICDVFWVISVLFVRKIAIITSVDLTANVAFQNKNIRQFVYWNWVRRETREFYTQQQQKNTEEKQFMQIFVNCWTIGSNCSSVLLFLFSSSLFTQIHSLNQTDNATKIPNIGTKPTSNGNGINNSMKLNNNGSSNGSINETNGKAVSVDEVSCVFIFCSSFFLRCKECFDNASKQKWLLFNMKCPIFINTQKIEIVFMGSDSDYFRK